MSFFLKSIEKNDKVTFIKTTEDPVCVASYFNSYLVQSICSFQVFQEPVRDLFNRADELKYIVDFLTDLN